ncbi:hypothetical protein LCGC14_0198030 [marine sediment metagenome]|uniref:Uncharacterized protein n=1 Tax=marine sediment metagenome TaxID=412755 RepID=A0A0F9UJF4_9ZZZZ|nr:hypothetical protein [Maribacter sp.]HDZ04818.1 hypothetical protein [Maribacter sp.]HEA81615.1 hypothetical protein [Maribacter sp.]
MKFKITNLIIFSLLIISCNGEKSVKKEEVSTFSFNNKGHELVYNMVQKVGNYKALRNKNDVVYTYQYQTPDGKTDVSTEKYLFNGELSSGKYNQHERTLSNLEGNIEQGYDGQEFWLKHNGQLVNDSIALKKVAFNRPTNFYWFTMFQKLLDAGVSYEYIGEETIDSQAYDIVKVSFNFNDAKPTDIYQLYINKNTSLVDQFLFTVADYGSFDTPNLMKVVYEEVDDMLLPTKRKYKKSTWEATVTNKPWITVNWTDIKFNNGLNKNDFKSQSDL